MSWHDWLINRSTDWLTDQPTDQLTDRPTDWLTDGMTDWLTDWLTDKLTRSDSFIMPQFTRYVVSPRCPNDGRIILSTAGESQTFVSPFTRPEQWKRFPEDVYNPYTPESRYNIDHVDNLGHSAKSIIPTPFNETLDESKLLNIRDGGWVIIEPDPGLENEAAFLAGEIRAQKSVSSLVSTTIACDLSARTSIHLFKSMR